MRYHIDFKPKEIPSAVLPEMPTGDDAEPETMRDYLKNVPDSVNSLPARIKVTE